MHALNSGPPGLGDWIIPVLGGYLNNSTPIIFSSNDVNISNSLFDQQCMQFSFETICTYQWSGTFTGGSVSIVASSQDNNGQWVDHESTGTITGGGYSGNGTCFTDFPCSVSLEETVGFTSTWTNGWRSDGTLDLGSVGDPLNGTLNMTTVTPEPGSMMLVGLGIAAIATFIRRRRGNPTLFSRGKMQYCTRA